MKMGALIKWLTRGKWLIIKHLFAKRQTGSIVCTPTLFSTLVFFCLLLSSQIKTSSITQPLFLLSKKDNTVSMWTQRYFFGGGKNGIFLCSIPWVLIYVLIAEFLLVFYGFCWIPPRVTKPLDGWLYKYDK